MENEADLLNYSIKARDKVDIVNLAIIVWPENTVPVRITSNYKKIVTPDESEKTKSDCGTEK